MLMAGLLGISGLARPWWLVVWGSTVVLVVWISRRSGFGPGVVRLGGLVLPLVAAYAGFCISVALGGRSLVPVPGGTSVPDVAGASEHAAVGMIRHAQLRASLSTRCVTHRGSREVASQAPTNGLYLKRGSEVSLRFTKRLSMRVLLAGRRVGRVVTIARARVTEAPNSALFCEAVRFFVSPLGAAKVSSPVINWRDGTYSVEVLSSTKNTGASITALDGNKSVTAPLRTAISTGILKERPVSESATRVIKLVFATQPTTARVGSEFTREPELRAENIYGDFVPIPRDDLKLSMVAPGKLYGCKPTQVSLAVRFTGCATIQSGAQTLRATYKKLPVSTESKTLMVLPARPVRLAFVHPLTAARAGHTFGFEPEVKAVDSYGNFINVPATSVRLSVIGAPGMLAGCTSSPINGAAFVGCSVRDHGRFRLHASDPALGLTGDSNEFVVRP